MGVSWRPQDSRGRDRRARVDLGRRRPVLLAFRTREWTRCGTRRCDGRCTPLPRWPSAREPPSSPCVTSPRPPVRVPSITAVESISIIATARIGLLVAPDALYPSRQVLTVIKSNVGPVPAGPGRHWPGGPQRRRHSFQARTGGDHAHLPRRPHLRRGRVTARRPRGDDQEPHPHGPRPSPHRPGRSRNRSPHGQPGHRVGSDHHHLRRHRRRLGAARLGRSLDVRTADARGLLAEARRGPW